MDAETKRSIIAHALHAWGKKRADRSQLRDGDSYAVQIEIVATIGRAAYSESVQGLLTVGHADQAKVSTKPNCIHLVAHILARLSPAKRKAIVADLLAMGLLSEPDKCMPDAIDLVEALTTESFQDRSAPIKFQFKDAVE